MQSKRVQPPWSPANEAKTPNLRVFNSLTRQKELFVPLNGKKITWYSCGPTVYDASHMGHARSYITFDILRRVLSEYFGYEITYVMNITDIDDKIIKRARQNHLFQKYLDENHSLDVVLSDSKEIMEKLKKKINSITDPDKKQMYDKLTQKLTVSMESLEKSIKSGDNSQVEYAKKAFISTSKDPLSDWLDSKLGHTVTDNAIFNTLPRHWEEEFHRDMSKLNILKPDVLTRVSEYIPEIIEYIDRIIKNGYAYISNNSVYFDVGNFDKKPEHYYAKLVPEAYGDTVSLQEGEGDLTSNEALNEKRSPNDFALWKRSKPGEPSWDSPWGKGRPGWHIECSAMASAIFGSKLDIHTGGIDLKFPHHDNEIAQSEAYFEEAEWVKYFLHSGHLTIAGCKMSKSLKNFVSIQDALAKYTARQLRFAFLMHSWRDTLDYSENTMEIATKTEKLFNEFFLNVKDIVWNNQGDKSFVSAYMKWTEAEIKLMQTLTKSKEQVHNALCDNIDTRTTLEVLRELVLAGNLYIRDQKPPNINLLQNIAKYITRILKIFGTITDSSSTFGFPMSTQANSENNLEDTIMPYLTVLSEFRENIRNQAKTEKSKEILKICDEIRDEILPNFGVRLEDKEGERTAVKLVDKDVLLKEKELKKLAELEKQRKKEERLAAQAEKEAQAKIPPSEMFKNEHNKYSKFDDKGFPTHDFEGKEISKGQLKKLAKLQQQQEKRYQEYLANLSNQ